jgi:Lrp/AsnC family leucine-responsive transcriptional regulator
MDPTDRQLIALLQANARHTYEELGVAVGLSGPAAYQRVRKLESKGVVAGYHAHVDPVAAGRPIVAFLWVSPRPGESGGELVTRWQSTEDVQEVHAITGSEAYLLKLRLGRVGDLERHAASLRDAGCSVHTEVALATAFERRSLPLR